MATRASDEAREATSLRTILDALADGIVVVDADGAVCFANPAAEQLFARGADELVGAMLGLPLVAGLTTEVDVLRPADEPCVVEMRVVNVEWAGRPARLASLRDVTERKQAEADRAAREREQAAREEAQATLRLHHEFVAQLSHDLKGALTGIKGYAQVLQRQLARLEPPPPPRLLDPLARIDESTGRMVVLANELLDTAQLQLGQTLALDRQPTDLVALARRLAQEHQSQTDQHRLRVEAAEPALVGEWDPIRLERVLDNLLNNAIKYSPEGGDVTLTLRCEHAAGAAWAVMTVHDGGIGIPPEALPRVFEPFYRAPNTAAHIRGTGLGLAGVRRIVEQHGGTIAVESQEGAGATFTVRLPLQPPA